MNIELCRAQSAERDTLYRLLQYSLYEESLTDLNEMNEDALFDYPWFGAYFYEPEREAYFIRACDTRRLLGFAMVRRHEDGRHSIAEFLVLPNYRRRGIGLQAAGACFALHDGLWEVKPAYGSEQALRFWHKAVAQASDRIQWMEDRFVFTIPSREE